MTNLKTKANRVSWQVAFCIAVYFFPPSLTMLPEAFHMGVGEKALIQQAAIAGAAAALVRWTASQGKRNPAKREKEKP